MAKFVDLKGHWATAIGNGFVAFGSLEHTIVVCLREIPQDKFQRFARSLRLSQRIDLLLELLEEKSQPECLELSEKLKQVKVLVPTRNLIAHNPLVLEFYEHPEGGYAFSEAIAAIHKVGQKITLPEAQEFAAASQRLATELVGASQRCFQALGITPKT